MVPILALLVVAYGEPRVVAADDGSEIGVQTAATPAQQPATGAQASAQASVQKTATPAEKELAEKKAAEKKAAEAELNEKLKALEQKYDATSDPALRKEIELKMKQLRAGNGIGEMKVVVNLNDPAAVEEMIGKLLGKIEMLEAKRASTTDAEMLAKLDQNLKTLTMKRKELKAALAELKGGA